MHPACGAVSAAQRHSLGFLVMMLMWCMHISERKVLDDVLRRLDVPAMGGPNNLVVVLQVIHADNCFATCLVEQFVQRYCSVQPGLLCTHC
jgi:hypothetical protein